MSKKENLVDRPITYFGQIPVETVKKIFDQHAAKDEKETQEKSMRFESCRSSKSASASHLPIRVVRRRKF
jgi:hypothetical protein